MAIIGKQQTGLARVSEIHPCLTECNPALTYSRRADYCTICAVVDDDDAAC